VRAYVKCSVRPDYSFPLGWTLLCWCCRLDLFELRDLDCAVGKPPCWFCLADGGNNILYWFVSIECVQKGEKGANMSGKMSIQKHEISWIVESGLPFIRKSPFD